MTEISNLFRDMSYKCLQMSKAIFFSRRFGVQVNDFGKSWRNGVAFNAIIHNIRPELVDMKQVPKNPNRVNLEHAFSTAETHLGIARLLDPEGTYACI